MQERRNCWGGGYGGQKEQPQRNDYQVKILKKKENKVWDREIAH